MAEEVKLPEISEGVNSAVVTEILVKAGDQIKAEQAVIAVESDKATMEVPSEISGTVSEVLVKEEDEIKVGQTILTVEVDEGGESNEDGAAEDTEKDEEKSNKEVQDQPQSNANREESSQTEQMSDEGSKSPESSDEPKTKGGKPEKTRNREDAGSSGIGAAPSVRRLARELGVSLEEIPTGGKGGRITSEDLTKYVRKQLKTTNQHQAGPISQKLPDFTQWGKTERHSISSLRKRIAESTTTAWQHIPHVTHFDKANAGQITAYRKNFEARKGDKISVTTILVKIIAAMLRQFPKFNASIDIAEGEVIMKDYFNVSFAVDTDHGLLVPVIKNADRKTLIEIDEEITKLSSQARDRKISPEDMQGGNFTISNLGGIGGTNFTPVIYPPQVAILGVAQTQESAYIQNGELAVKKEIPLGLSYDHRLIDGADAARFMKKLCAVIEQPIALME